MSLGARRLREDRPPTSEDEKERLARLTAALAASRPDYSARRIFSIPQLLILYLLLSLGLAGFAYAPVAAASGVVGFLTLFYLASFLFKSWLFVIAPEFEEPAEDLPASPLPLYSVLVPLYREAAVLPALLGALARLDYPKEKLDVKLILEADDEETRSALDRIALPVWAEIILVPVSRPRTKPKALIYGLSFAHGDYVVVYDAEDQPEPDQLRRALAQFAKLGPGTACLQARLNVYNAKENWLSRLFAIDYCLWFDHLLPGLERIGAPLPLGGTSNHFRRAALLAAGGWDPFNVTEDADLGIRLAREGYRTRSLNSTTFEEAPPRLSAWLTQRARWMKGYLQTWLVHSRDRKRVARETGRAGLLVLDLFLLGSVLAGIVNPVLWALFIGWLSTGKGVLGGLAGPSLLLVSLFGLVGGNAMLVFLSLLAPLRRGWFHLVPYALTAPLYWLLVSLAAWRGLFGLLLRPFHWAKTAHGLTSFEPRAGPSKPRGGGRR
jgi:glycosyltransferase XagB